MDKLTKIEPQKKYKDRVNIYVNDEFFAGITLFACVKHSLKEGMDVDKQHLKQVVYESEKESAFNKACNLLGKRIKTEREIKQYLNTKGYDKEIIDYVVNKLIEYGYIDDIQYATSYINTYKNKRGKMRLSRELLQKGIKKDIIENELINIEDQDDIIFGLATKYLKGKEISLPVLQKLRNYLLYRGFSFEEIDDVISKIRENNNAGRN